MKRREFITLLDGAVAWLIGEHLEIVIVPLTGWARGGYAFEDHRPLSERDSQSSRSYHADTQGGSQWALSSRLN